MKKGNFDTISAVNALIDHTYVMAIIVALVALGLAFLIAKMILFRGGKDDRSYLKRRTWFTIIGVVTPILFYLYNFLFVLDNISKAPLQAKFSTANIFATLVIVGIYFLFGILTMLIFRKNEWGSILGKGKY